MVSAFQVDVFDKLNTSSLEIKHPLGIVSLCYLFRSRKPYRNERCFPMIDRRVNLNHCNSSVCITWPFLRLPVWPAALSIAAVSDSALNTGGCGITTPSVFSIAKTSGC